ncbi:hypothetical protein C7M84_022919, partial [Penaeus vannamei]
MYTTNKSKRKRGKKKSEVGAQPLTRTSLSRQQGTTSQWDWRGTIFFSIFLPTVIIFSSSFPPPPSSLYLYFSFPPPSSSLYLYFYFPPHLSSSSSSHLSSSSSSHLSSSPSSFSSFPHLSSSSSSHLSSSPSSHLSFSSSSHLFSPSSSYLFSSSSTHLSSSPFTHLSPSLSSSPPLLLSVLLSIITFSYGSLRPRAVESFLRTFDDVSACQSCSPPPLPPPLFSPAPPSPSDSTTSPPTPLPPISLPSDTSPPVPHHSLQHHRRRPTRSLLTLLASIIVAVQVRALRCVMRTAATACVTRGFISALAVLLEPKPSPAQAPRKTPSSSYRAATRNSNPGRLLIALPLSASPIQPPSLPPTQNAHARAHTFVSAPPPGLLRASVGALCREVTVSMSAAGGEAERAVEGYFLEAKGRIHQRRPPVPRRFPSAGKPARNPPAPSRAHRSRRTRTTALMRHQIPRAAWPLASLRSWPRRSAAAPAFLNWLLAEFFNAIVTSERSPHLHINRGRTLLPVRARGSSRRGCVTAVYYSRRDIDSFRLMPLR